MRPGQIEVSKVHRFQGLGLFKAACVVRTPLFDGVVVHGRRVCLLKWYAYLLFRRDKFSPILAVCLLLQELIVDAWVVVKRACLQYIKMNQRKMKA
jgi:hypothetical protein